MLAGEEEPVFRQEPIGVRVWVVTDPLDGGQDPRNPETFYEVDVGELPNLVLGAGPEWHKRHTRLHATCAAAAHDAADRRRAARGLAGRLDDSVEGILSHVQAVPSAESMELLVLHLLALRYPEAKVQDRWRTYAGVHHIRHGVTRKRLAQHLRTFWGFWREQADAHKEDL